MIPTSLVLLDFQNDFFSGGEFEIPGSLFAAKKAHAILQCFRDHGGHTVHVQHENRTNGLSFCVPGTEGIRIHDLVAHYEGEPIAYKNSSDAFDHSELDALLRSARTSRVLLCGIQHEMTIAQTAKAAFSLGFQVILIQDACAGMVDSQLVELKQFCTVQNTEKILLSLSMERGY
jgi:nicotinamidase-related amidase